jgi:hypothetical protein
MGSRWTALTRLEYAFARVTFTPIDKAEVDAILTGERDAEVAAYSR